MKPGSHPAYGRVVFRDLSTGDAFLTKSTMTSEQTIDWEDGRTYPLVTVEVSRYSHPFWTGKGRVLDTAGRVERFRRRYTERGVADRPPDPRTPHRQPSTGPTGQGLGS